MGRFINADSLVSTGKGILGYNMFAYCRSNPVRRKDVSGTVEEDCMTGDDKEDLFEHPDGGYSGSGEIPIDYPTGQQSGSTNGRTVGTAGNNTVGTGQAPHQGTPGSTYTQTSSDGKGTIVSQTTYNEYGQRGQRIDWQGRDHGIGLPHIHTYTYGYYNGELRRTGHYIEKYFD